MRAQDRVWKCGGRLEWEQWREEESVEERSVKNLENVVCGSPGSRSF